MVLKTPRLTLTEIELKRLQELKSDPVYQTFSNETPRSKLRGIRFSQRHWPLACNYAASCEELDPKRLKGGTIFTAK